MEELTWLKDWIFSDQGAKTIMFLVALDVRRQVTKLAKALTSLETNHGTRLNILETQVGIPNLVPKEGT